jgi:hypothetical protein
MGTSANVNGPLSGPFHVFYSYSHVDRRRLDRLRTHLALLRRHGLITEWYDREIEAGDDWRDEIERELEAADVILLLVSADFLASDFAYEEEMLRAVQRAERGEAILIAVMLRPVEGWEGTPFAKYQVLPSNSRPVTRWSNVDEAYKNVAAGIRSSLEARIRSTTPELVGHDVASPTAADIAANTPASARAGEIRAALIELVDQSEIDEFVVVLGDEAANYYTQCFAEEGSFWCEAVSNEYLDKTHALTSDQTSQLATFGWNPPGSDLPNWWCVRDEVQDVCALFVRTLSEVYGVGLDAPLEIQRSWQ